MASADSPDDDVMPTVDYRQPGGLTIRELETTLRVALESGRASGLEVIIYNPRLDDDGSAGRALVELLEGTLTRPAHLSAIPDGPPDTPGRASASP